MTNLKTCCSILQIANINKLKNKLKTAAIWQQNCNYNSFSVEERQKGYHMVFAFAADDYSPMIFSPFFSPCTNGGIGTLNLRLMSQGFYHYAMTSGPNVIKLFCP